MITVYMQKTLEVMRYQLGRCLAGLVFIPLIASAQELESVGSLTRSAENSRKTTNKSARADRPATRFSKTEPREIQLAPLSRDEVNAKTTPRGNPVFGIRRKLEPNQVAPEAWERLPGTGAAWRLALRSSGAIGIRLHFTNFDLGTGIVVISGGNAAGADPLGSYTGKGPSNTGDFWTGLIFAESVVIEYQPGPANMGDVLPFSLAELAHVSNVLQFPRAKLPGRADADSQSESLESGILKDGGFGHALACEMDLNCVSDRWRTTAQSVGMYIAFDGDYLIACSGTLLNNKHGNFRPYFLTANHCVSDNETARNSLVIWDYQTEFCGGGVPDLSQLPEQSVARLLVTKPFDQGDYSLLLLDGYAPDDAVFAGWTTVEVQMGAYVAGIHHPAAGWKRFAEGNRVFDRGASVVDGNGNVIGVAPADRFYRISWTLGVTESGSSGSPLFNSDRLFVGLLSHGNTECGGRGTDGYGRLNTFFDSIRKYLVDDSL